MKSHKIAIALILLSLIAACSKKPVTLTAVTNSVPKPLPPSPKTPEEIFEEADYLAYITVEMLLDSKDTASYRRLVGSGMLIDFEKNFYVLTASHLLPTFGEVQKVWVRLKDKDFSTVNLEAEFLAYDRVLDIAVLAFKTKPEYKGKVAKLGQSKDLKIGEEVVALGSPGQIPDCLSVGVIENPFIGIDEGTEHPGLILHDAPVRPGNSGGPLLNKYGEVVGINIRVDGGNKGFWVTQAVPIDDAKELLLKIIPNGLKDWPHMMLYLTLVNSWDITPYGYERMGLKAPDKPGLVIVRIPAVFAELYKEFKVGDLIVEVSGEKIVVDGRKLWDIGRLYHRTMTDITLPESLKLTIERDGKIFTLQAELLPFIK